MHACLVFTNDDRDEQNTGLFGTTSLGFDLKEQETKRGGKRGGNAERNDQVYAWRERHQLGVK